MNIYIYSDESGVFDYIQLILGHTSTEIGERVYTHKTTEQLVKAIDKIIL